MLRSLIRDVKENEASIRKQMEDDHSSATRANTERFETQVHTLRAQLDNSEEQLLSLNQAVQDERRQRLRAAKLTSDAHGAFSEQFEKVRQQAENAASIIEANQRAMNTRNAELESQITALNDRMLSMQQSHRDEQTSLEEKLAEQKRYYEQRLQRSIDRQEQLMQLLENMQSAMIQV